MFIQLMNSKAIQVHMPMKQWNTWTCRAKLYPHLSDEQYGIEQPDQVILSTILLERYEYLHLLLRLVHVPTLVVLLGLIVVVLVNALFQFLSNYSRKHSEVSLLSM